MDRSCGKERWLGTVETLADTVADTDDKALWAMAAEQRHDLVNYARQRLAGQLSQRDESPQQVEEAARVLDPNCLTLGFARRFTDYKRPNLLLHDVERLKRLLTHEQHPVQLIIAGKAHPADEQGKQLIQAWMDFVHLPGCAGMWCFWRITTSRWPSTWCRVSMSGSTPRAGPGRRAAPVA
jgi:starch phosphorylase